MLFRVGVGAFASSLLMLAPGVGAPTAVAAESIVGLWRMNEAAGSRTLIDSSGNGLHGNIGEDVILGRKVGDSVVHEYPFTPPDSPPVRPGHLTVVPHDALLNPGSGDHAVTVRLRTEYGFGNIVQKGQSATEGGFFKLENNRGVISCLYRSASGQSGVSSKRRINDGHWHTVRCERTSDRVRMWVDGVLTDARHNQTGSIANSWPLSIAGKTSCNQMSVGCDYFAGAIDYVRIEKGATTGHDGRVEVVSDFASGIAGWSGVTGLRVDRTRGSRDDGTPSLRAKVDGEVASGRLDFGGSARDVCAGVDFKASRVGPEAPYSLMKLRDERGSSVARIRVDSEGNLSGRADAVGQSFATGASVHPERWHRLGLCVAVGEPGWISLSLDGQTTRTWAGGTGRAPITTVQLGDNSARTATVNWDELRVTSAG